MAGALPDIANGWYFHDFSARRLILMLIAPRRSYHVFTAIAQALAARPLPFRATAGALFTRHYYRLPPHARPRHVAHFREFTISWRSTTISRWLLERDGCRCRRGALSCRRYCAGEPPRAAASASRRALLVSSLSARFRRTADRVVSHASLRQAVSSPSAARRPSALARHSGVAEPPAYLCCALGAARCTLSRLCHFEFNSARFILRRRWRVAMLIGIAPPPSK